VMVASLFWVHGFLLPSHRPLPEFKTNKEFMFHQVYRFRSLRHTPGRMKLTTIGSRDNEVSEPAAATRTTTTITTTKTKGHQILVKKRRSWGDYFHRLEAFYLKHGHSNVTSKDDPDMFKFVSSLRNNYRRQVYDTTRDESILTKRSNIKTQQLSEEKIQSLEKIDFIWYVPNKKKSWEYYYPRLQEFHRKHGHCNVTREDDKDLNQYIASLRKNYAPEPASNQSAASTKLKSKRTLPDDKLQGLKDIDFSWERCPPPRTVRPGGKTWEEYFPRLKDFHEKHGHTNVTPEDDPDLFKYISSLRKNYRHQSVGISSKSESGSSKWWLPDEKFQSLQDLNFSWYTESRGSRNVAESKSRQPSRLWSEYYPKLQEFHKIHGHCNVTSEDDEDLHLWMRSLERRYQLAEDKIQDLQSLGVTLLKPRDRRRLKMQEMIPRLQAHQERFGRVAVTKNEDVDLNEWTRKYVRQQGYPKLWELLGFSQQDGKWRKGYWKKMYKTLLDYHGKTGHCQVDLNSGYELEYFVRDQRRQYVRWRKALSTTMTVDRIELLEEIDFAWTKSRPKTKKTHEERWNEMVDQLTTFREKYNHAEVPQEYEENPQLGRWVMNQRTFYRMNEIGICTTLSEERIDQLEQLDFVWRYREKQWWTMFGRLRDYEKIHGHLIIEVTDFVNEDVRQWLNEQRYFYKSNTKGHRLTRERIEALQNLPGFRWSGKQAKIPTKDDWTQLLGAIRERGISPEAKAKQHWFDGVNPFADEVKSVYSDDDLLALWNEENDPDDEEEGNSFYEDDEDSRLFLGESRL